MKFINLLKKELSELINAQMIFTLVIMLGIFLLMGNFMQTATSEIVEEANSKTLSICNMDDSDFTAEMIESFKSEKTTVKEISVKNDDYASAFENDTKLKGYVIIPQGFGETLLKGEKPELLSVSKIKSVTVMSSVSDSTEKTLSAIYSYVSQKLADQQGISKEQLKTINSPLKITEHTVIADKSAEISSSTITGKIMLQNMLPPIIIMLLIMLTSQSLISSISNEKIDKTLETLLSAPVSRISVITAKMLAAAIVAMLNAGVMMIGFTSYTKGMTETVASEVGGVEEAVTSVLSTSDAFRQLGINLSAVDYLFIGIQLFITIMICLAISIILGALVNDSKSAQTMLLPIIVMVMIPWIITLFTDVNSLPTVPKLIINAIPFTHTFSAIPNLMFGNTTAFWLGAAYQLVIFIIVMFFALKLFTSDKILTISLNLGQKSRFKKSRKTNED